MPTIKQGFNGFMVIGTEHNVPKIIKARIAFIGIYLHQTFVKVIQLFDKYDQNSQILSSMQLFRNLTR